MDDPELVAFLQRVLPRLALRWRGFRGVRGQVRKRLVRRLRALGLPDLGAYERHLDAHPDELQRLDAICRITVSRFGRDRGVWERLQGEVLPALGRRARGEGRGTLRAWSAGCASGEEPYTLSLLWDLARPTGCEGLSLEIVATDADAALLGRARDGCYARGTLRELPAAWIDTAFEPASGELRLADPHRERVRFLHHDIRREMPDGPFDLILCRNLAFTYFDEPLQRRVLAELRARLRPGGELVIGAHERLPNAASAAASRPPPPAG